MLQVLVQSSAKFSCLVLRLSCMKLVGTIIMHSMNFHTELSSRRGKLAYM